MESSNGRFAGCNALISGASGAVGGAIALQLAAEGARTALVGRRLSALEEVARAAETDEIEAKCYPADLTSDRDLERLASELHDNFAAVDLLIHCAATISIGPVECLGPAAFDTQYRLNLRAPYVLTRLLLPQLKKGRGQVVFISSSMGLNAKAHFSQYAATKAGLKAVADSLREEVNADGIRVLSVFIGRTASEMQKAVHAFEGRPYAAARMIQPRDVASMVLAAVALDRTAEVTEITIRPMAAPAPLRKGV